MHNKVWFHNKNPLIKGPNTTGGATGATLGDVHQQQPLTYGSYVELLFGEKGAIYERQGRQVLGVSIIIIVWTVFAENRNLRNPDFFLTGYFLLITYFLIGWNSHS